MKNFKAGLTILLAVTAGLSAVDANAFGNLKCKADQELVCIPPPPCRNGSIGCREAPRPEPKCFCADIPSEEFSGGFQSVGYSGNCSQPVGAENQAQQRAFDSARRACPARTVLVRISDWSISTGTMVKTCFKHQDVVIKWVRAEASFECDKF